MSISDYMNLCQGYHHFPSPSLSHYQQWPSSTIIPSRRMSCFPSLTAWQTTWEDRLSGRISECRLPIPLINVKSPNVWHQETDTGHRVCGSRRPRLHHLSASGPGFLSTSPALFCDLWTLLLGRIDPFVTEPTEATRTCLSLEIYILDDKSCAQEM